MRMSAAPTRLKATTNSQKSGRILTVSSAKHCQHSGCEVAVGGERSEAGGQIGADDAWKDEDEPEEAEAVQSGDGTLRLDPVHRLEPGPNIRAEAKQPRDVTENEMHLEDGCRGHSGLLSSVSWRGLEHRGQDAEPAFHEISPKIGG